MSVKLKVYFGSLAKHDLTKTARKRPVSHLNSFRGKRCDCPYSKKSMSYYVAKTHKELFHVTTHAFEIYTAFTLAQFNQYLKVI